MQCKGGRFGAAVHASGDCFRTCQARAPSAIYFYAKQAREKERERETIHKPLYFVVLFSEFEFRDIKIGFNDPLADAVRIKNNRKKLGIFRRSSARMVKTMPEMTTLNPTEAIFLSTNFKTAQDTIINPHTHAHTRAHTHTNTFTSGEKSIRKAHIRGLAWAAAWHRRKSAQSVEPPSRSSRRIIKSELSHAIILAHVCLHSTAVLHRVACGCFISRALWEAMLSRLITTGADLAS